MLASQTKAGVGPVTAQSACTNTLTNGASDD